jgi:DNA-binding LacI/PurR family transcriptional regulator
MKARKAIYCTARELNYTPDAIARAMVRKKTDNIGFIIHDQQYPVVLNPFYSPVFEGVLETVKQRGYSVFISTESDIHLPDGQVYMKKQMDGVIICGQADEETVRSFRSQNIPLVILNNYLDMEDLLCITVDNYEGSRQAIDYLVGQGHRKIAIVSGQFSPYVYTERYRGYIDSMAGSGLPIRQDYIKTVKPDIQSSMAVGNELLSLADRPTAIFATNDVIAIGIMKAALRHGYAIPDDLMIIGFDDSDYSEIVEPELTTVRIDKFELGKIATQRLIGLIEGDAPQKETIRLKTTLIHRATA